ncbi:unnamed protein product [Cuscuta campestris]|uniref:Uncharacterized protein n=1 Tax=Cuscuta campestris TaxID=132261 RepID=A0A484MUM1_9ASTE|nr:unnamed protein product [Cuscuta campestris]
MKETKRSSELPAASQRSSELPSFRDDDLLFSIDEASAAVPSNRKKEISQTRKISPFLLHRMKSVFSHIYSRI